MKTKVVFVTSHPIQYQVPVFRHLAAEPDMEFEVWFAMIPDAVAQGTGFGIEFEWDQPLLEGYRHRVLHNVSKSPSVTRFGGCDTPGIRDLLRTSRPDAVIVNGWVVKSCIQALMASNRLGVPCLVRGEANDLRERAAVKRALQRLLVRRYDACLYIGTANRAFYKARGVSEDRLFPSLYCVENDRFAVAAAEFDCERHALRERWNIPAGMCCFLYCGKFEPKKHPLELLEAFRKACAHVDNLHLLMVGDGALRLACESHAEEYGLPVTFTGFLNQSEIVKAYVASDCLVLPSDTGETWGLVVNEAMACGRPAIVSDLVGCAQDLVEPEVTGDVFAFGDWNGLSGHLRRYGAEPARLQAMGVEARRRIQRYSPAAAADGIQAAVMDVVARRNGSIG